MGMSIRNLLFPCLFGPFLSFQNLHACILLWDQSDRLGTDTFFLSWRFQHEVGGSFLVHNQRWIWTGTTRSFFFFLVSPGVTLPSLFSLPEDRLLRIYSVCRGGRSNKMWRGYSTAGAGS